MLSAVTDTAHGEVEAVVHAYLSKRYPGLAQLRPDTSLLGSGAIDSLGILELMTFLGERFDIVVQDDDFDQENFETLASLVRFINDRKRN